MTSLSMEMLYSKDNVMPDGVIVVIYSVKGVIEFSNDEISHNGPRVIANRTCLICKTASQSAEQCGTYMDL